MGETDYLLDLIKATARPLPAPHFTFYIAHRMRRGLLADDPNVQPAIIAGVEESDYLDAGIGSRQFVVTDFQGKRYRVTVAEEQ